MLFLPLFISAQRISSSLQKTKIAVGEVNHIEFRITGASPDQIESAPKNELLPFHFDEIKDEVKTSPEGDYLRSIDFMILDEGDFTIPSLEFRIAGKVYRSTPYELKVYNPSNVTDKPMDIMNNQVLDLGWRDYWDLYKFYIFLMIIVLGIAIGGYILWKYGRKRKTYQEKMAPVNKTLKALENLKSKNYHNNGKARIFYVELIDILREFLEEQYHFPASLLLTAELIQVIKKDNRISMENEKQLEQIMKRGDEAKFAKIFPSPVQMQKDIEEVQVFVKEASLELEIENLRQGV